MTPPIAWTNADPPKALTPILGRKRRKTESGFVGHSFGPEEGFHDAVCVKFKDLAAYREHARAPHGPDEANDLRKHVRVKSPYAVGC